MSAPIERKSPSQLASANWSENKKRVPADEALLTVVQKLKLDCVHAGKIRLSDGIFVVDVGNYLGESIQREIELAKRLGKLVFRLSDPDDFAILTAA